MKKLLIYCIILICILNVFSANAQTYQLNKINDISPSDAVANPYKWADNLWFSISRYQNQSTMKNSNSLFEYNGSTWTLHSSLNNTSFIMEHALKTSDNKYWALGRVSNPFPFPGILDTIILMEYKNNQWQKVKNLGTYEPSSSYKNIRNIANNSTASFATDDSCYFYENNVWNSIELPLKTTNISNISDVLFLTKNNIHYLISVGNNGQTNTITRSYYYNYSNMNWTLKDSIINQADPFIASVNYSFVNGVKENTPLYIIKNTVDLTGGYTPLFDLYTLQNDKFHLEKSLLSIKPKWISPVCNNNGTLYFLLHDYVWSNDTVEICRLENNNIIKMHTILDQLNTRSALFTLGNELQIASMKIIAPYKNELFKLVEKKPTTSNFSYNIQNMTVKFTKLDSTCKNFIWDFGNGNTSTINPNPIVTYSTAGTYSPCLKCENTDPICTEITLPCTNCSGTTTGISNNDFSKIEIFPNPTNELLYIDGLNSNELIELKIYSIESKLLETYQLNTSSKIDISSFKSGIYILQFNNGYRKKIVKY